MDNMFPDRLCPFCDKDTMNPFHYIHCDHIQLHTSKVLLFLQLSEAHSPWLHDTWRRHP